MGLGTWTKVEGIVYPTTKRYAAGFMWMVVDSQDRVTLNKSILRLKPYISKVDYVSSTYAAYNRDYQISHFTLNDSDKQSFNTAFDFRDAAVGTDYPLRKSSDTPMPFWTNRATEYVEYEIQHDDYGKANVKVYGYIKGEHSSSHFQYVSTTANITLPQIDRAASISALPGNIGDSTTIFITKTSSEYVCTIDYSFNGLTGQVVSKTDQTQISWQIPGSFCEAIPHSPNGYVTFSCTTYYGNTIIGTSTCSVLVSVSDKPTFSGSVKTDSSDGDTLISGVSTVTVALSDITQTPSAAGNPSIVITDGIMKAYTNPAVFEKAVKTQYQATVTDGRGLSTTQTYAVSNLIPYEKPAIGSATFDRDLETGDIALNISGKWFSGTFDKYDNRTLIIYCELIAKGETTGTTKFFFFTTSDTTAQTRDFNGEITYTGLELTKAYTAHIIATDTIYTKDSTIFVSAPFRLPIPRAVPIFQWNGETFKINGNLLVDGINLGKNGGDVALMGDIEAILARIPEEGTDNGWDYVKYPGGTLHLSRKVSVTPTSEGSAGNIYYSGIITVGLPTGFKCSDLVLSGVANNLCFISNPGGSDTTVSFRLSRGGSMATSAQNVHLDLWGKWS